MGTSLVFRHRLRSDAEQPVNELTLPNHISHPMNGSLPRTCQQSVVGGYRAVRHPRKRPVQSSAADLQAEAIERGEVSQRGWAIATGRLEAKLDRMLETRRWNPANRRLARHLAHERLWLFTFLHCFGLDATNNAAERAIRGMVIARKVWGGNRTWNGAGTHQILGRLLRTCWQQGKDAFTRCVKLLHTPRSVILDIVSGAG